LDLKKIPVSTKLHPAFNCSIFHTFLANLLTFKVVIKTFLGKLFCKTCNEGVRRILQSEQQVWGCVWYFKEFPMTGTWLCGANFCSIHYGPRNLNVNSLHFCCGIWSVSPCSKHEESKIQPKTAFLFKLVQKYF